MTIRPTRTIRFATAGLIAASGALTGVSLSTATASAEDLLHHVTYTVTSEQPNNVEVYYRDTDPPNFAEYSHNPYVFSPKIETDLGPGKSWVLDVMLANPNDWAMVAATSGWSTETPQIHCELKVDGVVVSTNNGPKGALCSIRNW
ncbi:hypothetical protein BH09ACT7_BH09ACT7_37860 [soil metagenome]